MYSNIRSTLPAVAALLTVGLHGQAEAQTPPELMAGGVQTVNYTGSYQDFTIPFGIETIRLTAKGGQGGNAITDMGCISTGGDGARVSARFSVGPYTNQIAPGGTLRFLVGGDGKHGEQSGVSGTAGDGGGGSGIIYLPPGADASVTANWEVLMVGGGGGGAHQGVFFGICVDGYPGGDASFSTTGGNGGGSGQDGGKDGANGAGGDAGGAGHGWIDAGPTGCSGGSWHSSYKGGWGFGGGSGDENWGGGGGGGYSGGGGSDFAQYGGGGGSYIHPMGKVQTFEHDGETVCTYEVFEYPDSCAEATPLLINWWSGSSSHTIDYDLLPLVAYWWFSVDGDDCDRTLSWTSDSGDPLWVRTYPQGCSDPNGVTTIGTSGSFTVPAGSTSFRVLTQPMVFPMPTYTLTVTPSGAGHVPGNDEATGALSIGTGMSLVGPVISAYPDCAVPGAIDPLIESPCEPADSSATQDVWFTYTNHEVYPTTLEFDWDTDAAITSVAVHLPGPGASVACASSYPDAPGHLSTTLFAGETRLIRVMQDASSPAGGIDVGVKVSGYDPWTDLGSGLAGSFGQPVLTATGNMIGGSLTTLGLTSAAPLAPAVLVVGLSQIDLPIVGGVLVPAPDLLLGMSTDATGEAGYSVFWPMGVAGSVPFYFQYWIVDESGPYGYTASNALRGTTPP